MFTGTAFSAFWSNMVQHHLEHAVHKNIPFSQETNKPLYVYRKAQESMLLPMSLVLPFFSPPKDSVNETAMSAVKA